jgi:hypothetical protein
MTPSVVQPATGKGEFARSLKSREERGISFGTQRITGAQSRRFLGFRRNWHAGFLKKVFAFGIITLTYDQWLDFILAKNETLASFIKSDLDQYLDRLDVPSLNFIEELFATSPEETKG